MIPLPVDAHLPRIVEALASRRAVVVTAAPGAGKTTRVPPSLVDGGRVILLQPRRVAARAIARRIAAERGWTLGRDVGWQVRFDRRFGPDTRLLVATEGILTARLLDDPLLAGFHAVVIDEFHERSLHADIGLALAKQAWLARDDLRLVVMSATLDTGRVSSYLGDCPVIDVPGRTFDLDIEYRPGAAVEDAVAGLAGQAAGATLCFLPGAREIGRAGERLVGRLPAGVPVLALHGGLDADAQDAALRPADGPRVILATNLAETTLTVPDVTAVVDTGWHKVARYDAARGIDGLHTERVSQDSADQRAGRAGRLGPGHVIRLWDARDRLRPHREPEIARVDLAPVVLDVLAWGGDPRTFDWFDAPPAWRVEAALGLLSRLGAIDEDERLTPLGRAVQRLPVHPRLGRLLLAAGGAPVAARACALLAEGRVWSVDRPRVATSCDLLAAADPDNALPPHVLRVARDLERLAARVVPERRDAIDDETFSRAVLAAYPDRVARRRAPGDDRFLLASGAGARLARESGVVDHQFVVAIDVAAMAAGQAGEALIRLAAGIEPEWLVPTEVAVRHELSPDGVVRAARAERVDAVVIREEAAPVDPEEAAGLLVAAFLRRDRVPEDVRLLRRLSFAGLAVDLEALARAAAQGARRLDDIRLARALPPDARHALDRDAPETLAVPSGRRARLDYRDDGRVVAAVKLQELFGLADTPRIGPGAEPVVFELLAPNGRPVQVTTDLRSFWTRGYPEVRTQLRARYPKHPWPDDPWTATPTHRTTRRR